MDDVKALPDLLARLGSRRVLLLTGPSARHVERIRSLVLPLELQVFTGARRHVPDEVLAEAERALVASGADTIVALGGGSTIGLGKALRLSHELHFVAIPTTYAGSENTSIYGVTREGRKTTGRDPRVRPVAVIRDVELTLDMPKALTVTSLMNALAHPLSALGAGATGELLEQALVALETVYGSLETLVRAPGDRGARAAALRGSALAAGVLEAGSLGAHHRLAHRVGGEFDLEHGALHSVLLPHSVHRLRSEVPELISGVEQRLGVSDWEAELFDLLLRADAATSLKALGVDLQRFRAFVGANPELPLDLLSSAFHGRRPSAATRLEDWGLPEPVSLCGPRLEVARRIVVAVHGRGATADSVLRRVVELAGDDPTLTVVAPQARDNAWYAGRYSAPRGELGDSLALGLQQIGSVLERVVAQGGAERVVLFGFSQGACLALELFERTGRRLAALVALSGARLGPASEQPQLCAVLTGTPVLLGASLDDPWLTRGDVERAAEELTSAGCLVELQMVPGDAHALHALVRVSARELLTGARAQPPPTGFGNAHESESLPGALPRELNTPRNGPYGLYPEQINATGFTARRGENLRAWMYRMRPAAQQGVLQPLVHTTFRSDFANQAAEPNLVGFAPLPLPSEPTDFIDGLATLGGSGSAASRRGYAMHVYALNRGMEERAFYDADGDLLLLPELGALTILTELGVLHVKPGELALLPRGLRFSVVPRESAARGYLAEAFGRHFTLPERGPIGSNGLADARHFRAPAAWHENRLAPGFRITAKLGGELYEATQDYSPYDVVAWHGNHCPYVYDLSLFSPFGTTRIDHPDPSIHTVLSAALDEQGAHTLDLVAFTTRWDPTEGTFRPPFFHRNATTELNGILRDVPSQDSPFAPGCFFLTPCMTPHGVSAGSVQRALALSDEDANRPQLIAQSSLWFQFESALPFSLSPWPQPAGHRRLDWHSLWGNYRSKFQTRDSQR